MSMRKLEADATSTLGSGTSIQGRITGDSNLTIEGTVQGDIAIQGELIVSAGAHVHGSVEASAVAVEGTIDGDIVAAGSVHAGAGATLRANVKGEAFSMDEGAVVVATVSADFDLPEELCGGRR